MSEHKYRAWHKQERRMVYADEIKDKKGDLWAIGFPDMCNGTTRVGPVINVPSRAGGIAWSYREFACDGCSLTGKTGIEDSPPKSPHKRKIELLPSYCTDMNDAWQIVEKMNKGSFERYNQFINEMQKLIGSELLFDALNTEKGGASFCISPDSIAIASLRACGVEIEL